jgi:hypothetical protein
MFGALRRYVIRRRFAAMVRAFDQRIAEARAKHRPTRPIEAEKSAFVHAALAAKQPGRPQPSQPRGAFNV